MNHRKLEKLLYERVRIFDNLGMVESRDRQRSVLERHREMPVCACGECDGSGWIEVPDPLDSTAPWSKEPCPFLNPPKGEH